MRNEINASLSLSGVTAVQLRLLVQNGFFSGIAQAIQSLEAPRHKSTHEDWMEFISSVKVLIDAYRPTSPQNFVIAEGEKGPIYAQELWAVCIALNQTERAGTARELFLSAGNTLLGLQTAQQHGFPIEFLSFGDLAIEDEESLLKIDSCRRFHFGAVFDGLARTVQGSLITWETRPTSDGLLLVKLQGHNKDLLYTEGCGLAAGWFVVEAALWDHELCRQLTEALENIIRGIPEKPSRESKPAVPEPFYGRLSLKLYHSRIVLQGQQPFSLMASVYGDEPEEYTGSVCSRYEIAPDSSTWKWGVMYNCLYNSAIATPAQFSGISCEVTQDGMVYDPEKAGLMTQIVKGFADCQREEAERYKRTVVDKVEEDLVTLITVVEFGLTTGFIPRITITTTDGFEEVICRRQGEVLRSVENLQEWLANHKPETHVRSSKFRERYIAWRQTQEKKNNPHVIHL